MAIDTEIFHRAFWSLFFLILWVETSVSLRLERMARPESTALPLVLILVGFGFLGLAILNAMRV